MDDAQSVEILADNRVLYEQTWMTVYSDTVEKILEWRAR